MVKFFAKGCATWKIVHNMSIAVEPLFGASFHSNILTNSLNCHAKVYSL